MIQSYDLLCVAETKTDLSDIISFPNYTNFLQCRKQPFVRKGGGIGIFIKDELANYVTIIESESDYVCWLKLSKSCLNIDENLYLGAIYVPPVESRFHTQDKTDIFEEEISSMCDPHWYVLLLGNFNANTLIKEECLDVDDFRRTFQLRRLIATLP